MKTNNIILKKQDLESLFFTGLKVIIITLIVSMAFSCSEDDCEYNEPCLESCDLFEDFEDETLGTQGNWLGIDIDDLEFQINAGSQALYVEDGSGGSWAYNTTDFPSNLINEGCTLRYDVSYLAGSSNSLTTDNGIYIFSGSSPVARTEGAIFALNSSNLVVSGNAPVLIEVPLELATGITLPSNSYGEWRLSGVTLPYTATDIATFNTLIQNISGVGFAIDEGSNPSEKWWFDNFCFKQCCPVQ